MRAASSNVSLLASTRKMCSRSISSSVKWPPTWAAELGRGREPFGKRGGLDDRGGPKDRRAFDGVAQLADVARPRVVDQHLGGRRRELRDVAPRLTCEGRQEAARERQDVLAAVAQRGHPYLDDVEPIKEILAELPGAHRRLEVAVGRGDHADVGVAGPVLADALEVVVLKESQQLGLDRRRDLTNLVEEHRAALGGFDPADLVAHCAGEGPARVPEELARNQVLGQGGTVRDDKG